MRDEHSSGGAVISFRDGTPFVALIATRGRTRWGLPKGAVSEGETAPGIRTESRSGSDIAGVLSRGVMGFPHRIRKTAWTLHLITTLRRVYTRAQRFCHSFSNSARFQNDFCVPTFVVERAA